MRAMVVEVGPEIEQLVSRSAVIKTIHVPLSHPFVERLIGTLRREYLDRMLFWTTAACFKICSGPEQHAIQILASKGADQPFHERMGQGNVDGLDFCHLQHPLIGLHWWN